MQAIEVRVEPSTGSAISEDANPRTRDVPRRDFALFGGAANRRRKLPSVFIVRRAFNILYRGAQMIAEEPSLIWKRFFASKAFLVALNRS